MITFDYFIVNINLLNTKLIPVFKTFFFLVYVNFESAWHTFPDIRLSTIFDLFHNGMPNECAHLNEKYVIRRRNERKLIHYTCEVGVTVASLTLMLLLVQSVER